MAVRMLKYGAIILVVLSLISCVLSLVLLTSMEWLRTNLEYAQFDALYPFFLLFLLLSILLFGMVLPPAVLWLFVRTIIEPVKYRKVKYTGALLTLINVIFFVSALAFINQETLLAFVPLQLFLPISRIFVPLLFFSDLLLVMALPFAILWLIMDKVKHPIGVVFIGLTGVLDYILFAILLCGMVVGILASIPERITNTAQMNGQYYYLTLQAEDFTTFTLYQCSENGVGCKEVLDGIISGVGNRGGLPWASGLVVVEELQEIHVFGRAHSLSSGYIDGSFAPRPYLPRYEEGLFFREIDYGLYSYALDGKKSFLVTRCNPRKEEVIDCQILPVRYTTLSFKHVDIIDPKDSGNIEVWVDGRLVFSYDSTPHCHTDGCVIIEP